MVKNNKIVKIIKKYSVVDLIRFSCTVLLAFLLTTIIIDEKQWWLALIFSVILFSLFMVNGYIKDANAANIVLYSLEFFALLVYGLFYSNDYLSTVYSLVLVDFYLKHNIKTNIIFGTCCFLSFGATTVLNSYFLSGSFDLLSSITLAFNDLIVFALVFCIVNMLGAIIAKNKEIKEITELEERNRIAKRIHDTTGHSLTTIIMQTEAAKLQIDTNPKEAKNKIISANLQAISALEELRKSVHILSSSDNSFDLIAALNKTINETMDGTDIVIRSKIPETLFISESLAFFIDSSLKEGLNNGIRHGKSTAFYFELKAADKKLNFLLSDNGEGSERLDLGYGLTSLKETAEAFGGKAEFFAETGEGFEIKMILPFKEDKS